MKLKSLPEDFQVEEVSTFTPDARGAFFVYELEKRSLSTMEAINIIARKTGMRPADLSPSGLKDKHGLTRQLFSATRHLKRVEDDKLVVRFVGKSRERLTARHIVGNRFLITLRALTGPELAVIPTNLAQVQACGLPNYYDDQRFGGVAHGQGFIARSLIAGDFENALKLHLATPHRKQNMRDKSNRRLARELWGNWSELHQRMKSSSERALVQHLRDNPGDFAGCFERVTPPLRSMFLSAYQSMLFNRFLCRAIEHVAGNDPDNPLLRLGNRGGELVFYRTLDEARLSKLKALQLPLVAPQTRLADFGEFAGLIEAELKQEGITLQDLRMPALPRTRFKAASRDALLFPQQVEHEAPEPDELNPGRSKLMIAFQLGRGSFATMLVKRLVLGAYPPDEEAAAETPASDDE